MTMTTQYEATRSSGPEPMTLIFPVGTYELLPFEIRLMGPWYGAHAVEMENLKPAQRFEIARQGYTILREQGRLENAA
ncbi:MULTISPECIES: hypothetical protein [Rhodomicrobium]|uniref:hypothetical protein n=1 Tax=Rhodomicrobium TaxID=1068 RepID=UPI000F74A5EF|nr:MULTISPECIES: hypothetical protein [Rhodomicrobium]